MTTPAYAYELAILLADNNMEQTVKGLLQRPASLRIREINIQFLRHPQHDSGCRVDAIELLRLYISGLSHFLGKMKKYPG